MKFSRLNILNLVLVLVLVLMIKYKVLRIRKIKSCIFSPYKGAQFFNSRIAIRLDKPCLGSNSFENHRHHLGRPLL